MPIINKINRIKLFVILSFCCLFSYAVADNTNLTTNYCPVDIIITQSDEYLPLKQGNYTLNIPKFSKSLVEKQWDIKAPNLAIKSVTNYRTLDATELTELSYKLGVKIDQQYLELYREITSWLGTKYKWAGYSKKGIDCSGFTNYIYKTVFNRQIDRNSYLISRQLKQELPIEQLQPGDLVFFATNRKNKKNINHVGVYLGQGSFAHASINGVKVSNLTEGFYAQTFIKAGRL